MFVIKCGIWVQGLVLPAASELNTGIVHWTQFLDARLV